MIEQSLASYMNIVVPILNFAIVSLLAMIARVILFKFGVNDKISGRVYNGLYLLGIFIVWLVYYDQLYSEIGNIIYIVAIALAINGGISHSYIFDKYKQLLR